MDTAAVDLAGLPWPAGMYASDDLARGISRMPRAEALTRAYVAPNPRNTVWAMVFDVDHPGAALRWQDAHLPPPTWTTTNPKSGHGHLAYRLAAPVARSEMARLRPLRMLARIQRGMTVALDADRAYTGLTTQTPGHSRWTTVVWRPEAYSLDELRDWLPDNLPMPTSTRDAFGIGRNVMLFNALRCWAYPARLQYNDRSAWATACERRADEMNQYVPRLPTSEVRATARSVAKWAWSHITPADFARVQAARGRKRGAQRASAAMDRTAAMLASCDG